MVKKKLNSPQPTAPEMQDISPGPSTLNQPQTMNQTPTFPAYNIQPGLLNLPANPYQICYSNINEMKQLNV